MAKVSISEAARLAGVARSNFYTTYIKQGRISVSVDSSGKKYIDTSELLRAFPEIKQDTSTGQQDRTETGQAGQNRTVEKTPIETEETSQSAELELLKTKLTASESQVKELQRDKQWLQDQVSSLTDSIKLLEHQRPEQQRHWWQFWK